MCAKVLKGCWTCGWSQHSRMTGIRPLVCDWRPRLADGTFLLPFPYTLGKMEVRSGDGMDCEAWKEES